MDLVLLAAACSTAGAVFCLAYSLQQNLMATSRAVRARTLPAGWQNGVEASPQEKRWEMVSPLSESNRRTALALQQAGWPIRISEFNLLRFFCAIVAFVVGLIITKVLGIQAAWLSLMIVGLFALLGSTIPSRIMRRRREKRLAAIDRQLPEFLSSMAKSLRAGAGLLQALGYSSDETPEPLGPEVAKTLHDLQLGGDPDVVFEDLRTRAGSSDLDIAVTAMMIQRTVGGNLSEILSNVANTIRERHAIRSEVNVLTSRQRLTANLVACLPVLIALAYLTINPDVGQLLFTTLTGNIALAIGIFFEVLGLWIIRRLSVIEY